ncbi:MAG: pyridoxamine 5'-phosphate oxidase family protein [Acidimicrobiia bacterium]
MVSWSTFHELVPEFGTTVAARCAARRHCTLATLRPDGSPRLSGTELTLHDGELCIGIQAGAARIGDITHDARTAVHVVGTDPDPAAANLWPGDVRIEGRAVQVPDAFRDAWCAAQSGLIPSEPFPMYRIDIEGVVWVHLSEDGTELLVDSWRAGRSGIVRTTRT